MMQRKFFLGFLVLILVFSMILCGFSNFDGGGRDADGEMMNGLEPTQPEAETTESELTEAEPAENEQTQSEHEQTESKPAQQEPKSPLLSVPANPEPIETGQNQSVSLIQANYSISVEKAINFCAYSQKPEAMLWLDVIHRRFGIGVFSTALERFDQLYWLADQPSVIRMFRRIADYNNRIIATDFGHVTHRLDHITLPALYCDRLDLPSDYLMVLEEGVSNGGYELTHVLLAWIWMQENGCELELPDGFVEDLYHANAALIDADSVVTDLEMEAAAFLCLAGQGDLIDDSFLELVIASQDIDGGWESGMRWHTTVLGLLYLLHIECPSDTYPPVLAPEIV
jgi:hypothetical protein